MNTREFVLHGVKMSNFGNFPSFPQDSPNPASFASAFPPMLTSMYLWDICKHGDLFHSEAYQKQLLLNFSQNMFMRVVKTTKIPSRFNANNVYEKLVNLSAKQLDESIFSDSIEEIDSEKVESIEELANESKEEGTKQITNLIDFLKDDIFPPTLWMEYSRLKDIYKETMIFLVGRLERFVGYKPKKISQIKERNRLVKMIFRPFACLGDGLINVGYNFKRIYLFMELMSCETEEELFSEKLWTFNNEQYNEYEEVIFDFHNSLTELEQNLYSVKPDSVSIDFSDSMGWAFKQLIQTVKV